LLHSLQSVARELPLDPHDVFHGSVVVLVVNMHGRGHDAFDVAEKLYAGGPLGAFFEFHTSRWSSTSNVRGRDSGSANEPGWKVRKQTRDLVALLHIARGKAQYFLFMEDDVLLCPHGLTTVRYVLNRVSLDDANWFAIRASFGMNGIFVRDADLLHLADYLWQHQARRPPDHLVVEWYAGETNESARYRGRRQHYGFRYNIFHHVGSTSTLRYQRRAPETPTCYQPLIPPVVFQVEAHNPHWCRGDDLTPCLRTRDPPMNFAALLDPPR